MKCSSSNSNKKLLDKNNEIKLKLDKSPSVDKKAPET